MKWDLIFEELDIRSFFRLEFLFNARSRGTFEKWLIDKIISCLLEYITHQVLPKLFPVLFFRVWKLLLQLSFVRKDAYVQSMLIDFYSLNRYT